MGLPNRLNLYSKWHLAMLLLLVSSQLIFAGASLAQKKSPSDKVVQVIENLAIPSLQSEYMRPDGTVIKIDKSDPKKLQIPIDDKRRIIRVGRLSAWAVICNLKDLYVLNYETMYNAEVKKKKWSKEQLAVIHAFHMSTLAFFAGDVVLSEEDPKAKEGKKEVAKLKKITCSEDQRAATRKSILEYVQQVKKS